MTEPASLRIVFMGSPDFAVPIFEAVARRHAVVLAVTQPDRPAGRGRTLRPPPVKQAAEARGVPVLQPTAVRTWAFRERLAEAAPDALVVAAYGRILPGPVLAVPRLGAWNVHASLLPAWRGAAPIQWSILSGDPETGVTLMRMDEGMDTGDSALQRRIPISEQDTAGSLSERLAALGAEAITEALTGLAQGTLTWTPQDHERASYAPPLKKADGRLDFRQEARAVSCRARGVDPWPGAHAPLQDARGTRTVKLFAPRLCDPSEADAEASPGEILGLDDHGLRVRCGSGAVSFGAVQVPGKRRVDAADAVRGRALQPGQRFE